MCALASRAAQHGHAAVAIEQLGEAIDIVARRDHERAAGQEAFGFRRRRVGGALERHVARYDYDRDAAIADSLPDGDLQGARHLVGRGNELAIMTALFEKSFGMGLLEIPSADLGRWDLRRNRKHRYPRAVAVEQAIDEVQIAGPATASANGELAGQMRLRASREGGDFLVPDMDPFDFTLSSQGVSKAVKAIADNAIDLFDACYGEDLHKLISD
jgi:hypothetical protein